MSFRVVTPSAWEPVTVDQARQWCRIAPEDESDDFVAGLIARARDYAEQKAWRQLGAAVLRQTLPAFPLEIRLYRPPLLSVQSIVYVSPLGDTVTLAAANYHVDTHAEPAVITAAAGTRWPATQRRPDAVRITYQAGYDSPALVPATIAQAILALCKLWYDGEPVPSQLDGLFEMFRHGAMEVAA